MLSDVSSCDEVASWVFLWPVFMHRPSLCFSWTFMWRFCFVFLFADVLFYLNIENNNPVLFTMLFLNSWFHPLLSFLRWQVEWSSSKRLWKRCRNQNHHKDYISRGCDPEPRKLRTRLTFCSICFQTTWFQVAQTNGLQGENGKDIFEGGWVVLFFDVFFCLFVFVFSSNEWRLKSWTYKHKTWKIFELLEY